jgi:hypothetical protein
MQSAVAVSKGGIAISSGIGNRRIRVRAVASRRASVMPERLGVCSGARKVVSGLGFGVEMSNVRSGVEGMFRSREKSRYQAVEASSGAIFIFHYTSMYYCALILP